MSRLEVRLTAAQRRFLHNLEEDIRQSMPEGERDSPVHRRITKSSIVRVMVEIFRQLDLKVDARSFRNESDLLQSLFQALLDKLPDYRTTKVTE